MAREDGSRRALGVALVAAALLGASAPAPAMQMTGSIVIPTYGSPSPARMLFLATETNGLLGWALPVPLDKTSFSLLATGGPAPVEDFAVTFYDGAFEDLGAPQRTCNFAREGNEQGQLQADPKGQGAPDCNFYPAWAVVTLSVGLNGSFSLTFS